MLQEFTREAGIGTEQQRVLAADDPGIEMRHRHWRRADRRLAVSLGMVALVDFGIVAAKPNSADREAAIAAALGNAGFLQQWQRAAACADEYEFCLHRSLLAAIEIVNLNAPAPIFLADEVGDAVLVVYLAARLVDEMTDQMMSERTIIYVRACDDARRRDRLIAGPALHHQRCPFRDLLSILGVFHAVIAVVRAHRLEPLCEERDVAAVHEAHMRHGMDERARIGDRALLDEIRPELT